ncbi:Meiotically up-regulated protein [Fusarium oxysporum f. sp. albedinis]|nr:Meiotically up-regulated protein [Fusarium oxysporum f. sp. albedinis]
MKERYPCKKDELLIVGTLNAITFGPFLSLPHGHGRSRRFPTRHSIMVLTEFSIGDVLSGISWDIYKTVSANERLAESFVEGVRFQRKVADCGA